MFPMFVITTRTATKKWNRFINILLSLFTDMHLLMVLLLTVDEHGGFHPTMPLWVNRLSLPVYKAFQSHG
jgi:hypothetical protein